MDSVGVLNIQTSIICNMHIFRCLMYNGVKKILFCHLLHDNNNICSFV